MPIASGVTLRQLRAFAIVAREGSFTRAAQRMHLTQSALSVLVRGLERAVQARLLDRTTRSIELSEAGRRFLPVVEKLLAELDSEVDALREGALAARSRLAIAASPLLAQSLLPPLLAEFRGRHPEIEVQLQDLPIDRIARHVAEGGADLGIGTFDPTGDELAAVELYEDTLVLACPAGDPLAASRALAWRSLEGVPLAMLAPGSGIRTLADGTLEAQGVRPRIAYEVAQVATALSLVQAGLACAIVPAYALQTPAARGIEAVPLVRPTVARKVVAIRRRRARPTEAARAFLEFLAEPKRFAHRRLSRPEAPPAGRAGSARR